MVIRNKNKRRAVARKRGVALIMAMIFIVIFSCLAVSLAAMSSTNLNIANNQSKSGKALSNCYSGLEFTRYWLEKVRIPGNIADADRLEAIAADWYSRLVNAGIENIYPVYDSINETITISDISIESEGNNTFSVKLTKIPNGVLQAHITGNSGTFSKYLRVNFAFDETGNSIFNFGVASKGPLQMSGNSEVEAANIAVEASVYIEGNNTTGDAFSITNNASVAGEVSIANPYATYDVGSKSSVGGATGDEAHDKVHVGVDYADFPIADPYYFKQFATTTLDSSNFEDSTVIENAIITAGTNPTFSSDMQINGVLYIEQPNNVSFAGKAEIRGIIAGENDLNYTGTSSLKFSGQVVSYDVSTLEGSQFDAIKAEQGTFIIAPEFSLDFSGQAMSMNGAIAGSGISFTGQAGGVINGSLINYSDDSMYLSGNSSLTFSRTGAEKNPAGFVPIQVLNFDRESYTEPML